MGIEDVKIQGELHLRIGLGGCRKGAGQDGTGRDR
jgi:hypothetical protein